MKQHITILGSLYIAFSVLGILAAIIVFAAIAGGGLFFGEFLAKELGNVFGTLSQGDVVTLTMIVGSAIGLLLVILSVPGIIGGVGLLKCQPWARMLVLIMGFMNLINIPFGTILGIYTIWVLMNEETQKIFTQQQG
jgi:hypothetical protein